MMFPPPIHRQTLVALRARRLAHRIASDLLHPPLDPLQFFCRHCGHALNSGNLDCNDHVRCDTCGLRTRLPARHALEIRRRHRAHQKQRSSCLVGGFNDLALWAYVVLAVILVFCSF